MILIATINDPHEKLLEDIIQFEKIINQTFDDVYLCVSDATANTVYEACHHFFSHVKIIKKNGAADARRRVLSYALELATVESQFMYCDFDRIITWFKHYPIEIEKIANKNITVDYTIVGRTKKAFESHPVTWQQTENITNTVASDYFKMDQIDITAGSAIITYRTGELISQYSKHSHTDCEWPLIVKNNGGLLAEIKTDGLMYTDINEPNLRATDEYKQRLKLSINLISIFTI